MFGRIAEDVRAVFAKDPAARSVLEVVTCYPGLHAVWAHRISSRLWRRGFQLPARLVAHTARFLTGIEIHPGATLGRRCFIDHGLGVVIGETAELGDDVLMYQGVVLGGTSLAKGKRHPTLRAGVTIGAGAIVLGPITIGAGARIGAGSVVLRDVPAGAVAVGVPARITSDPAGGRTSLDHGGLPDPVAAAIRLVLAESEALRGRMDKLERLEGAVSDLDKRLAARHTEIAGVFASGNGDEFAGGGGI